MSAGHTPSAGGKKRQRTKTATNDLIDAHVACGLRTIDMGDIYTGVEESVGNFIALRPAGQLVRVHTKFVPDLDALGRVDNTYVEGVLRRSLSRLQIDRLPLVQFHWWDLKSAHAKSNMLRAAKALVRARNEGLLEHIGLTNFDASWTRAIVDGGIPVVSTQIQYSLLDRRPERELVPLCLSKKIDLLCYGTLAGGFLTDKWIGELEPKCLEDLENRSLVKYLLVIRESPDGWSGFQRLLREMRYVADARSENEGDVSVAQIALAWILGRPAVASAIVGARGVEHTKTTCGAARIRLTEKESSRLTSLSDRVALREGKVYALERERESLHGKIMKYNLNGVHSQHHVDEIERRVREIERRFAAIVATAVDPDRVDSLTKIKAQCERLDLEMGTFSATATVAAARSTARKLRDNVESAQGTARRQRQHKTRTAVSIDSADPLSALLARVGRPLVLDGGLATALETLERANLDDPLWSATCLLNSESSKQIRRVHEAFFRAGADIAITSSYQASFEGFGARGMTATQVREMFTNSARLAREASRVVSRDTLVAISVGPYGAVLSDGSEYTGRYGYAESSEEMLFLFHTRRMRELALAAGDNADLFACETIPCLAETRAIVRSFEALDVGRAGPHVGWISLACKDGTRLNSGDFFADAVRVAEKCDRVVAVGINCTAPRFVQSLLAIAREHTKKPLVVYPNSGESWDSEAMSWEGCGHLHASDVKEWIVRGGASAVGGCCRVLPGDIERVVVATVSSMVESEGGCDD